MPERLTNNPPIGGKLEVPARHEGGGGQIATAGPRRVTKTSDRASSSNPTTRQRTAPPRTMRSSRWKR